MKQKFEKELKVRVSETMHVELREIAIQAGLYVNELIRIALRNELTRQKKALRESFLKAEDYRKIRDEAAERGIEISQVLSEYINYERDRRAFRQNAT